MYPQGSNKNMSTIVTEKVVNSNPFSDFNFQDVNGNKFFRPNLKKSIKTSTDADVREISYLFCECDDKNIFIATQVYAYQQLERPPSILISTGGKSVHAYWKLSSSVSVTPAIAEEYRNIQFFLAAIAGDAIGVEGKMGDTTIGNLSRYMRMPGFQHPDTGNLCEVIEDTGIEYDWDELGDWIRSAGVRALTGLSLKNQPLLSYLSQNSKTKLFDKTVWKNGRSRHETLRSIEIELAALLNNGFEIEGTDIELALNEIRENKRPEETAHERNRQVENAISYAERAASTPNHATIDKLARSMFKGFGQASKSRMLQELEEIDIDDKKEEIKKLSHLKKEIPDLWAKWIRPAMGDSLAQAIEAESTRWSVPHEIYVAGLVTSISQVIGGKAVMEIVPGECVPLNLYTVLIGDAGSGKSPVCEVFSKAHSAKQAELEIEHDRDMKVYNKNHKDKKSGNADPDEDEMDPPDLQVVCE